MISLNYPKGTETKASLCVSISLPKCLEGLVIKDGRILLPPAPNTPRAKSSAGSSALIKIALNI
jgi:hypothetical protein